MPLSPGASLRALRERKPLIHQITNYVVMNETANATLALGALPVMAHAREEVEEMVALAGALVLNIGTLSPHWVDAMRVTVLRGNPGEVANLVGRAVEVRGVESMERGDEELARAAAQELGVVASVTGAVDHVSDGERVVAVANGHELLATVSGTGCMSSAVTGCFVAVADDPLQAAAEALVAFGVAGEDAARGAKGPGSFHVNLYDPLAALDPDTLDARAKVDEAARARV